MKRHCFFYARGLLFFLCLMAFCNSMMAMTNGLLLTPPMGYNSWYANGPGINETNLMAVADTMVSTGMRDVGYNYLCVDDGWASFRDTNGVIVADTNKFPSGMPALIAYVHSKGLKFGIYTVMGSNTCAGYLGSYGHVVQDANTYAAWGVDYLKYEGCSFPDSLGHEQEQCELMLNALKNCGRPIAYTMSIGPYETWMPSDLNMWRGTGDFSADWSTLMAHIDFVSLSAAAAEPGGWNDPDVLGAGFLNEPENSAIFSMWCVLAAPLLTPLVGPNLTNVLCNPEAIAVDQDALGIQGTCVASNASGLGQVWCKPLGTTNGNVKAVALLNRDSNPQTVTVNWSNLGLPSGEASVRNLWTHAYAGNYTNSYTATLPPHAVNFVKITYGQVSPPRPVGTNYLSDLDWLPTTTNPYPIGRDTDTGGTTISLHNVKYAKGLGAHAVSHIQYAIKGATRFHTEIGLDDDACCGGAAVIFTVSVDGTNVYNSGAMTSSSPTQTIDLNVTGGSVLTLDATNGVPGNTADHADWAGAYLLMPTPGALNFTTFRFTGTNLVVSGSLGSSNAAYYVFSSTNATVPLSQWTCIGTNAFDNNGNFTFTNHVAAGSRTCFYRIQMQ